MKEIDKLIEKARKQEKPKWKDFKKTMFLESYIRNGGNCNAVARELGLHRVQVYRYRDRFVLEGDRK